MGTIGVSRPIVECAHCNGCGKCNCRECVEAAAIRQKTSMKYGHDVRCDVCGGAGTVAVRAV